MEKRESKGKERNMSDNMKSAVVGTVITSIVSIGIFVAGEFTTRETLENQTIETLAEYFQAVDKDMAYDEVLKTIYEDSKTKDEKISELVQENKELQSKVNELNGLVSSDEAVKTTIASAKEYADANDYAMALAVLNAVTNKTQQMELLMDDYTKKYEVTILSETDVLVQDEKYDEAVALIEDALKIVPDSTVLQEKKEKVLSSEPVELMSVLQPYEVSYYTEKAGSSDMQMGGAKYYNGFSIEKNYSSKLGYAIFNLDKKYTELKGIIGHIDGSGNENVEVNILADGKLIKTFNIGYQDLPQEFSIDVTNVSQLKFERDSNKSDVGFAELMIK